MAIVLCDILTVLRYGLEGILIYIVATRISLIVSLYIVRDRSPVPVMRLPIRKTKSDSY